MGTDSPYYDFGAWMSLLIWWPVVQVLGDCGSAFDDLFHRESSRRYPDGTVVLGSTRDIADAWGLIEDYGKSGFHVRQNTSFRALACFPQREYRLLTTMKYFERIGGEQDLLVCPTFAGAIGPGEANAARLPVRVKFLEPVSSKTVDQFRVAIEACAASTSAHGMFGEGPVRLDSASLVARRSWMSFFVDAASSGQNTINWLTLSILNFAAHAQPVSEIRYGEYGRESRPRPKRVEA